MAQNVTLTGTLRDVKRGDRTDGHPDFQTATTFAENGLVESRLGSDGTPVLTSPDSGNGSIRSGESFFQWYHDVEGVNVAIPFSITMTQSGDTYTYRNLDFFPIDDRLFGNEDLDHNYHFTFTLHAEFVYEPGQTLSVRSDDDLWIFVDGSLALDFGGPHGAEERQAALDTLGLQAGQRYGFDLFYAERGVARAVLELVTNFPLTDACGDGTLDGNEECDDGNSFNRDGCSASCQVEPCGTGGFRCTPTPGSFPTPTPTPRAPEFCSGDCDGSGIVTVDELVLLVNTALGVRPVDVCGPGDLSKDGSVTVDELVTAVNSGLLGCPVALGTMTSAAHAFARAVVYTIESLPFAVNGALGLTREPDECVLGGLYDNECRDASPPALHATIDAFDCLAVTLEGPLSADGHIVVTAPGSCPDVVLPFNIGLDFDVVGIIEDLQRHPLLRADLNMSALIETFSFKEPPCRVNGVTTRVDGRVSYSIGGVAQLAIEAEGLRGPFRLEETQPKKGCEALGYGSELSGALRVIDARDEEAVLQTSMAGLKIDFGRLTRELKIDGGITSPCLGGTVVLSTPEPLRAPLGDPCFTGGVLEVDGERSHVRLTFGEDGSVSADRGADGSTEIFFSDCKDVPPPPCGG